jgi:hypothetical protein
VKQKVGASRNLGVRGNIEGGPATSRLGEYSPVPEAEIAIIRMSGVSSEQVQQRSPLLGLVRQCVELGFVFLLAGMGGIRNKSHTSVGREASRSDRYEPLPRLVARHDPRGRRNVRADNERHASNLYAWAAHSEHLWRPAPRDDALPVGRPSGTVCV